MLKVECKVDFSWEANQYKRGGIYTIPQTDQYNRFLKVGYFRLVVEKVQEFPDKETLEEVEKLPDSETLEVIETTEKELKIDKRTKEYKNKITTK